MIAQRRPVGHARVPEPDRRDHQALLEDAGGVGRHRAGHGAADVVVVAEGLDERDDLALAEDRHGDAEVGQVADAALGAVDVVVEEDVALAHLRRSGSRGRPGARARSTSGRSACAAAGRGCRRGSRGRRGSSGCGWCGRWRSRPPSRRWPGSPGRSRPAPGRRSRPASSVRWPNGNCGGRPRDSVIGALLGHDEVEVLVDAGGEARVHRHRRAELLDDRRAGRPPCPARRSGRQSTGVSTYPSSASKQTVAPRVARRPRSVLDHRAAARDLGAL